jgi:hypothetical protein
MRTESNKELWWITRMLSGLLIAFSLAMFISYRLYPEIAGMPPGEAIPLSTSAIIGLSIMGMGLIGLGLAWKWELTGSIISLVAFFVYGIIHPGIWQNPWFLIWPVTAILFIVLWVKSRNVTVKNE